MGFAAISELALHNPHCPQSSKLMTEAMYVMNYFPAFNSYPTDKSVFTSRYFTTTANVLIIYSP